MRFEFAPSLQEASCPLAGTLSSARFRFDVSSRLTCTAPLHPDILDHAPVAHGPFLMEYHLQFRKHRHDFTLCERPNVRRRRPFILVPAQTALADHEAARL